MRPLYFISFVYNVGMAYGVYFRGWTPTTLDVAVAFLATGLFALALSIGAD